MALDGLRNVPELNGQDLQNAWVLWPKVSKPFNPGGVQYRVFQNHFRADRLVGTGQGTLYPLQRSCSHVFPVECLVTILRDFWLNDFECRKWIVRVSEWGVIPFLPCVVTVVTQSHGTHPLAAWLNRRVYPPPSGIASGGPNENGQCMECSRDE